MMPYGMPERCICPSQPRGGGFGTPQGLRHSPDSELELTFTGELVTLVHRGLGEDRPRFDDPGGWDVVLTAYAVGI